MQKQVDYLAADASDVLYKDMVTMDRAIDANLAEISMANAVIATAFKTIDELMTRRNVLAMELGRKADPNWFAPAQNDMASPPAAPATYVNERRFYRESPFPAGGLAARGKRLRDGYGEAGQAASLADDPRYMR